ncbi:phage holin family protein [Roseitranquillus sediminis]|uniref:phage holin family protein n=1 Tax=Roseitranquillus sediminis TaxID=2809051 RepID=UPI001D0CC990|nr:phage holin family protein [Roseitranquillus sediminis]MBM9593147.1 phage holin family protein [Roseitranquillus sediminis]
MTDRTTDPTAARSTTSLLSDAMAHVSGLVRKEIDLVRAELSENAHRAGVAIGLIVGAVVLLLTALNVLSAALVSGLAELGIDAGWAALIVGLVYLVVAVIMVKKGTNDLKSTSLAPTRSARNVQKDAHAVKETING